MRGKGRIEVGGATDDSLSQTYPQSKRKKKEKEKKETNEYRTYKIRRGPYVTCRTCSTYTRIWKANRRELLKSPRTESIGDGNTVSLLTPVPCGSSVEELSRPSQPASMFFLFTPSSLWKCWWASVNAACRLRQGPTRVRAVRQCLFSVLL